MEEIEIKLQVPPARRAAVLKEVAGRTAAAPVRLQAAYFDTPDRALAQAGMAWRLRREGRRWVQTLKGPGADGITRFEHEVPRPGSTAVAPRPDAALHAGTASGDRLQALLAAAPAATLACIFRTDIRRVRRTLRTRDGSVELAFDQGTIEAGGQRLPVRELEIELVRGTPQTVLAVARRWIERHGLWIDVRSKAERGDLLARGEAMAPERKAAAMALDATMDLAAGRRAVLRNCLDQVIVNASQVADGRHGDEHVHQLRVGLRRLRTALRLFDADDLGPVGESAAALFRQLGAARDLAAVAGPLQAELQQALAAVGLDLQAPALPAAVDAVDPVTAVRAPAAQALLLELLAAVQPAPAAPEAPQSLRAALSRRLNRWHRRVAADAPRWAELDDAARHALRKRVKRLRYAVEFAAALFDPKPVQRYLKPLRALQERLGALNDVAVGLAGFRDARRDDPRDLFALGWLAARRERLAAECLPALRAVAKAKRFWKKK
jgi:triphosphatase